MKFEKKLRGKEMVWPTNEFIHIICHMVTRSDLEMKVGYKVIFQKNSFHMVVIKKKVTS